MTDTRLQEIVQNGADVTIKLTKRNAFVLIKFEGQSYKATGGNLEKATNKAMEAFNNHTKNIKNLRKEKERLKERLLEVTVRAHQNDPWDGPEDFDTEDL